MLKRKRITMWILIVLGTLGLMTLISTYPYFTIAWEERKNVENRFNEYISLIGSNNYEKAYLMGSREFKAATDLDEFVQQHLAAQTKYGELVGAKIDSHIVSIRESQSDWVAVLEATSDYSRADMRLLVQFRHEQGQWVVFGAKTVE